MTKLKTIKLTYLQIQTINELKQFYIDHMIETYDGDWDEFWEDHTDIRQIESELGLI